MCLFPPAYLPCAFSNHHASTHSCACISAPHHHLHAPFVICTRPEFTLPPLLAFLLLSPVIACQTHQLLPVPFLTPFFSSAISSPPSCPVFALSCLCSPHPPCSQAYLDTQRGIQAVADEVLGKEAALKQAVVDARVRLNVCTEPMHKMIATTEKCGLHHTQLL